MRKNFDWETAQHIDHRYLELEDADYPQELHRSSRIYQSQVHNALGLFLKNPKQHQRETAALLEKR